MSIKLKSIEIEAFRAYNEKQEFNFQCMSGKTANLVMIYAPNGFGKTSFFDAVEWSITGKINRISKNPDIKNIADDEQGNILKNTESKNKFASVKILGEQDNILEVNSKALGVYNRKTDYCPGELIKITSEFKKLQKMDFCSNNLLAHDKIDAFLRFSNPKERYETLTNFWDVNKDTETYKSIISIYKEALKKEDEMSLQIDKLRTELAGISFSQEKVTYLTSLIKTFNQNKYQLYLDEVISGDVKKYLDKCLEYRTQIANWNLSLTNKSSRSVLLKEGFDEYSNNLSNILAVKNKITDSTLIIDKYNELIKKELMLKESNEINKKDKEFIDKYNLILINSSMFRNSLSAITELYATNYSLNKEITDLNANIVNCKVDLLNVEKDSMKLEEQSVQLQSIHSDSDEKYKSLIDSKNKQIYLNKRISLLNKLKKIRTERTDNLFEETNRISSYLSLNNKMLLESDFNLNKFLEEYYKCKEYYNRIKVLNISLQEKEKEYIEFGKLNDQINNIVKHGKSLIEETKATKCPLCNKEYTSFSLLLESVNSSFEDTLGVNRIYNEIKDLKALLVEAENMFNSNLIGFKNSLENEVRQINGKIQNEKTKVNKYTGLIVKRNNFINRFKSDEKEIMLYFSKLQIDISSKSLKDLKSELLEKIELIKSSIVNQNQRHEDLLATLKKNDELIIFKKNTVEVNIAKIEEISSEPLFIELSNIQTQLGIDINSTNLEVELKQLTSAYNKKCEENSILRGQILDFKHELQNYNLSVVEYDLKLLKNKAIEIEEKIFNFSNTFRSLMGKDTTEILLTMIEEKNSELLNEIALNETLMSNLVNITEHLDYLQKNKDWIEKNSKICELETGLKQVIIAKKELEDSKDTSIKYILNRIDSYFNLNIINQIYTKIDPHPDLTYIKFEPEFTKDVPEINIYAYNSEGSQKISPILYLSSAQVNILSLSIFLAKSLQNKNHVLNTIFMDDPIQHLDSINILSFIDLVRTIVTDMDRQIIISTHNENFYKLIKKKIDPEYFSARYIELSTYGKLGAER
jgi:hypothetical protein